MAKIKSMGVVRLKGIIGDKNASAAAFWKDQLLIVADEVTDKGNVVQAFEPKGVDFLAVVGGHTKLDEPGKALEEMDLEGIAVDGNFVYVLGSHSSKRKKVDPKKPHAKNRQAIHAPPEIQPSRDVLIRFELDDAGKASPLQRTSLRQFLANNEPFKSFGSVASKENGVDAEGIAVWKGRVYVGFRGPVLRGNFTPILKFKFGQPISLPEVLYVNLQGRGVRDLARVDEGLLILAGPVGDGPGTYQVYLWDGRDQIQGTGAPTSETDPGIRLLGELPIPNTDESLGGGAAAKPEGLALVKETQTNWDVLVVFDGLEGGHASRFRIPKN